MILSLEDELREIFGADGSLVFWAYRYILKDWGRACEHGLVEWSCSFKAGVFWFFGRDLGSVLRVKVLGPDGAEVNVFSDGRVEVI